MPARNAQWRRCTTFDADYNGYAAFYWQLCPATCNACDKYQEPTCRRDDACCCEAPGEQPNDGEVDCESAEGIAQTAECRRRCNQCAAGAETDADGNVCSTCDPCRKYAACADSTLFSVKLRLYEEVGCTGDVAYEANPYDCDETTGYQYFCMDAGEGESPVPRQGGGWRERGEVGECRERCGA